ncbi:MAG: toxic anion resistance protein [Deltaproteobacteria bacterium]|jgi:uncharacterized protein YaaN involved in tellurite resistance|nr:toxic anion resistance protein [Deltaproteobacteria bacterium]
MALFSLTVPDEDAIRRELGAIDPRPAAGRDGVPARGPEAGAAPPPPMAEMGDPSLAEAASRNAELIMGSDPASPADRARIASTVERYGLESMRLSADKARLLASTAGELARAGEGGGLASSGLAELGRVARSLDPSGVDFEAKGFLGLFPPAKGYFRRLGGAEGTVAEISRSMVKGKSSLRNDNITLQLEQGKLKEANQKLRREIALGLLLDSEISRRLEPLKAGGADPERVSFVEGEVLFPLRQRLLDLQQTLAVNNQGLVAMELVSRNNAELIRGVDRALTVTLAALRTSVAVAGALYNQKIALRKLQEFDAAAAQAAAEGGARWAGEGGPAPGGGGATVERLRESFRDVMSSLDEIERFRAGAAASMRDSVGRFRRLAGTADGGEGAGAAGAGPGG